MQPGPGSRGAARQDLDRFRNLTFEDFRRLATDATLSRHEKVGFPDSYRQGKEGAIFADIVGKLSNLSKREQVVVDIGPGCSGLPLMMIDLCRERSHSLILIDSAEMLSQLPDEPFVTKIAGYYPRDCEQLVQQLSHKADVILTYSVLHYVFTEGNLFDFLDKSLSLLNDGGELLIGDIPNVSKRKRFFASPSGVKFHQAFTGTDEQPAVHFSKQEAGQIDDAIMLSLVTRCRAAGFDAYVLPQRADLPMANRREDVLVRRP